MEQTTDWKIRLKEVVLGPLKRITEMAGGAQKKITGLASATSKFAKETTTAGKMASGSLVSLQNQLKNLEALQVKAWDTKHIQNYQRAINKVKSDIDAFHAKKKLPEMQQPTNWGIRLRTRFSEGVDQISGGGSLLGMLKNPALLFGAAALAIASFGKASVDTSMQFQQGMAKINATAQLPITTLGKLEDRLVSIGSKSGGNFDRVTDSYEKILSMTGKVNLSLDILQVGIKGAKAGFADLDLVGKTLAQTLSVVGEGNTSAAEVMDTLLKAKAVGAGEFADFAQYLPTLIASGKSLSSTYKDVAGLFSFMTFKGQSAMTTATLMENVFTALQKKDLIVGMKKKGIDLFNIDGSRKNIGKVFLELSDKLKGLTDKQKTKFLLDIGLNDAQARTGFNVLTSDANNLKRIMLDVNNAIGETDRQLSATGNRKRSWADIADQWKSIGKSLGDALMPVVDALGGAIQGIINATNDLLTLDMFNMQGTDRKSISQMRESLATEGAFKDANRDFLSKYGFKKNSAQDMGDGADVRDKFFKDRSSYWKRIRLGNDNKIVDNEETTAARKALDLLNKQDTTTFGKDGSTGGGNKGPSTLIMNLDIKNYFSKGDEKVKEKTKDDIVDAARDAMVTVGGNQ